MGIKKIYEDENLVAINKPAGILVHSDEKHKGETVVSWLLSNYPKSSTVGDDPSKRPGIVHRLDKETSGVLILCKNQEAYEHLKKLFKARRVKKTYKAIVVGSLKEPEGEISKEISIKHGSIRRTVHKGRLPKKAVTKYKVEKEIGDYSLLDIFPETGRTHQIRVHMASIHHPVVGDKIYGGKPARVEGISRQMLHAYSLEFEGIDGKKINLIAEPPEDFGQAFEVLKKKA